jgi:Na+/proline symporter
MVEDGGVLATFQTDYLTLFLLLVSLIIFFWLAVKSHSIRSFQFQTSVFIAIMVVGGIMELLSNNGIIQLPSSLHELGFLIHVGSMIFFSLMIWLRYYTSKKSGRRMIEEIQE